MKAGFLPGVKIRPAADNSGILGCTAILIRYDRDGFYIAVTPTGRKLVVHEEDVELDPNP